VRRFSDVGGDASQRKESFLPNQWFLVINIPAFQWHFLTSDKERRQSFEASRDLKFSEEWRQI